MTTQRPGAVIVMLAISAVLSFSTGCTIALKDIPLDEARQPRSGRVQAAERSDGIEGLVGWGTLTLFAIPVAPIFIVDDTTPSESNTRKDIANREVMQQVHRALRHVGYDVAVIKDGERPQGPTLKCHVERFRYRNYTWLVPIIPIWGSAVLTTTLESSDGRVLWSGTFEGDGFTFNFFNGFSSAANSSMEEILNQMVESFGSDEFASALASLIW